MRTLKSRNIPPAAGLALSDCVAPSRALSSIEPVGAFISPVCFNVSGVLAGAPFIVSGQLLLIFLDQRRLLAAIHRRLRRGTRTLRRGMRTLRRGAPPPPGGA